MPSPVTNGFYTLVALEIRTEACIKAKSISYVLQKPWRDPSCHQWIGMRHPGQHSTFGVFYGSARPTPQQLLAIPEHGSIYLPIDAHTDCRNFFELATSACTVPQDKSQRLYILAQGDARATGRPS